MRCVVQRVSAASVTADGQPVGAIGPGLAAFVGIAREDGEEQAQQMARKLAELRLFPDEEGKLNLSLPEVRGELLLIPNFTVLGDCAKGRRPSFDKAAPPEHARALFESLAEAARAQGLKVSRGQFGAIMQVEVHNFGPVTLIVDTKNQAKG